MPDVESETTVSRLRRTSTAVGVGSLVLVAASYGLLLVALTSGVHCPQCDRVALGARYYFWEDYFSIMDATLAVSLVAAITSVVVAHKRRYAVLAICLAIGFVVLRPL